MASFQAKIGWKRQRKREDKNKRPISFLLTEKQKIQKTQQKIKKIKKILLRLHFKPKQVGKG